MINKKGWSWNLDDVLPIVDFEKQLRLIEIETQKIEEWWEQMSPKMTEETFKSFIDWDEGLGEKMSAVAYLPELMEAINQKDSQARMMKAKVNDLMLSYSQKTRKFGHWFKGLEVEGKEILNDKEAKRLFESVPDLEYKLNYSRMAAKYSLSQKEEEVIDNKDVNLGSAVSDLRSLIESGFEYEMLGKKIKTQGELLKYVHDKDKKKREAAYRALLAKHKEDRDKFFVIYQAVIKDWAYETKVRGFTSPISRRNFGNHISDKAIEALLQVCQDKRKIFWRYFDYKAKVLGVKKLNRFDIYAPIKGAIERKYSLEESKSLILESYRGFSDRFAKAAEKVLEEKHIDSEPKPNKRSGAFCATVGPKVTPYVLLNHTGTARDVSTMAHELGHAIHSLYANKHYASSQHATLPLAETASTLGEMILFDKMREKEKDKKIKKQMLWEKMGESWATIVRQNYFVMFEIEAHRKVAEGTTAEELEKVYLQNLKEQFGPRMEVDPIFKYEWMYVSHIFESPFYCYAYNFGELLTLSLYGWYKEKGQEAVEKIEKILEIGGAKDPGEVLREVGIEIESKAFWEKGWQVIDEWQNELESV